jgi:hypothetical protein
VLGYRQIASEFNALSKVSTRESESLLDTAPPRSSAATRDSLDAPSGFIHHLQFNPVMMIESVLKPETGHFRTILPAWIRTGLRRATEHSGRVEAVAP